MSYSFFTYGSLMSKSVLLRVLCGVGVSDHDKILKFKSIQLKTALLKEYKQYSLKQEDYPAVIYTGDRKDVVHGMLIEGLELVDILTIDCYEDNAYKRIPVQVLVADTNTLVETEGYIWMSKLNALSKREWSFDEFMSSGKEQSLLANQCKFVNVDRFHLAERGYI